MANVYRNISIRGLGELLGQTRSGQKLVAGKRRYDDSQRPASGRRAPHDPLLDASSYAYFACRHELYLDRAAETGAPSYSIALIDCLEAPRVLQIDIDAWSGEVGQTIRVKARDNVGVASVTVVIRDAQGSLLETGEAVRAGAGSAWWHYTTRSCARMTPFPRVEAIARDLPGNEDSFTI